MLSENFLQMSGVALLLGGTLTTAGWVLFAWLDPHHEQTEHRRWLPLNFVIIAGGASMALGVPGFYAAQAEESGALGLIGSILLFIGIVIPYVAVHSIETATAPHFPPSMRLWISVGAPSAFLGIVISGIATGLAGVYPPLAGVLLILSALLGLLTIARSAPGWLHNLASTPYTLTIAWLGILVMGS